jgi:hypothetical protein
LVIVLALGKIHGKEILYAGQPDSLIGSHPQSLDEVPWLCAISIVQIVGRVDKPSLPKPPKLGFRQAPTQPT